MSRIRKDRSKQNPEDRKRMIVKLCKRPKKTIDIHRLSGLDLSRSRKQLLSFIR